VADSRLEYVHGAFDGVWRFELAHRTKGIGQQLLVLICVNGHPAGLQVNDMKMVAIDQDGISRATKRWVQRLQAFIQIDFDQLLSGVFHQRIDKVGIALGHGHMVRISAGWDFFAGQNDLRQLMDGSANGSGLTGWLIGNEGFEPV
jgi:hypothetical protein